MSLFSETVYLLKRPQQTGTDSLGDPIFGEPERVAARGWVDAPVATSSSMNDEITTFRETLIDDFTLYLDGIVDLGGVDRVDYRGDTFEVDGEPAKQAGGFVVNAYTMVRLKKVEG